MHYFIGKKQIKHLALNFSILFLREHIKSRLNTTKT
jgi:hypothetical protein